MPGFFRVPDRRIDSYEITANISVHGLLLSDDDRSGRDHLFGPRRISQLVRECAFVIRSNAKILSGLSSRLLLPDDGTARFTVGYWVRYYRMAYRSGSKPRSDKPRRLSRHRALNVHLHLPEARYNVWPGLGFSHCRCPTPGGSAVHSSRSHPYRFGVHRKRSCHRCSIPIFQAALLGDLERRLREIRFIFSCGLPVAHLDVDPARRNSVRRKSEPDGVQALALPQRAKSIEAPSGLVE